MYGSNVERRTRSDRRVGLAAAIDAGGFGFILLDGSGRVLSANAAAGELVGRPQRQLVGEVIGSLIHPDDRGWSTSELDLLLVGAISRMRHEVRLIGGGGSEQWIELDARRAVMDTTGSAAIVMLGDASDRVVREQELRRLADTDPLTNLYNRRRFEFELERHLALARRYSMRSVVLLLDIDGLERINDAHGHRTGDRAITATAELLRNQTRSTDVAARIGGDEFAILLPHTEVRQAGAIADMLATTSRRTVVPNAPAEVAVSIGIAPITGSDADPAAVLERADAAMHTAKRAGGNSYAVEPAGDPAPAAPITNGALRSGTHEDRGGLRLATSSSSGAWHIGLKPLLETVAELGTPTRSLVAWELYSDESAIIDAWFLALREHLLAPVGYDVEDRAATFGLTREGHRRLDALERASPDGGSAA